MENNVEYIKLFIKYESDDMPVVYFYEVNLDDDRFCLREMEVFVNRQVSITDDLYRDVIEAVPIPTKDEFNSNVWGEGICAFVIPKDEFEKVWESGNYGGELSAI